MSKRLFFGVAPAAGIPQNFIGRVLNRIDGVLVFYDDVLISGKNIVQHNAHLRAVLDRFKMSGSTVKSDECQFLKNEVEFLGYLINENGISVSDKRVDAVSKIETPKNVTELRRFLGMIN